MNLVRGRQLRYGQAGEQPGQARVHAGADDERDTASACGDVEVEHRSDVGEVVADGHDGDLAVDELSGEVGVEPCVCQHDDRHVAGDVPTGAGVVIDQIDTDHGRKAPRDPLPDDTATDHRDSGRHESGSSRGRHPPCCGGVPPVPRTRSTAAANPINAMAENARRRNFIRRAG